MPIPTYRSTSQRRTLKTCGWKYYLKYDQGWSSKVLKPAMLLGSIAHKVLEEALKGEAQLTPDALEKAFHEKWDAIKDLPGLAWSKYRQHAPMRVRGGVMLRKACEWILAHVDLGSVTAEQRITYRVHDGSEELVIIDLMAKVGGKWTVLDWKTSDKEYDELKAELDEQLTAGQLAVEQSGFKVEQVGLVVLTYGTEPKVQPIFVPARKATEIMGFIANTKALDDQILKKDFRKNPDSCFQFGRCEMYPLCFPSQKGRIDELLEQREVLLEDELLTDDAG